MSDNDAELFLHEQVMLLALRDETGTMEAEAKWYRHALGGAILAELILRERIRINDAAERRIEIVEKLPMEEPVLDEALAIAAQGDLERKSEDLVELFAGLRELKHKVAGALCSRGILSDSRETIFLLFTRKVYPEIDHGPEERVISALRSAIFSEKKEVDARTSILLSLASASGLLKVHFDEGDLVKRAPRIQEIATGSLLRGATRAAIEAMEAAGREALRIASMSGAGLAAMG